MRYAELITEADDRQAMHDARQAAIKGLEAQLEARYPGLALDCYIGSAGNLIISKIVVPKEQRDQGVGTAVMTALVAFADQGDLPVSLTPDNSYGGSVTRLKAFYRRFGFRPNKGRVRDFRYSEAMLRRPNR